METNNTLTLTTAAAWRAAITLTITDVRAFFSAALFWAKTICTILCLLSGIVLVSSDSDSFALNALGFALIALFVIIVKRGHTH